MKTSKIITLSLILLMLINDGCKCKKEEEPQCPTCGVNEECVDMQCQCKPGATEYLGSCVMSPSQGNPNNGFVLFVNKTACLSFDTSSIMFSRSDLINIRDYDGRTMIGSNFIWIDKLYNLVNDPNKPIRINSGKELKSQSGVIYRFQDTVRMNFLLNTFAHWRPFFYNPPGHDRHPYYYETWWYGKFSQDLKTINFKVVLREYEDNTQFWTKLADSCDMVYELWE